jgi:ribonuclease P protein component
MDATFPPALRLHDGRDYGRVFNRQQKAAGKHVVVLVRSRRAGSPGRLGVMVPSKSVPSSVRRHQLKRWVRELFRLRLKPALHGCDAVVLFRRDPPPDGHAILDGEILALVPKALAAAPNPDAARQRRGGRPPRPVATPVAKP